MQKQVFFIPFKLNIHCFINIVTGRLIR